MKSRKMVLILSLVAGLVGILLIAASMDFAGDMVVREARKGAKEYLGADLAVGGIRGNPLKGYVMENVALAKNGKNMLSAGFIEAKINLLSLLSSPKLSLISVGGVEMDVDTLAEQIAKLDFKGGGSGEIPIEEFRLVDSLLTSKWARAAIRSVGLSFSGKTIDSDLDLDLNAVPMKGKASVLLDGPTVDVRSLSVNVGKGTVNASGAVAPKLAVSGTLKDLDIGQLVAFWPVVPAEGFDGTVSGSFTGEGAWNAPFLAGDLNYGGTALLGYPVQSIAAKWAYGDDKLSVTDLVAQVLGMPLAGHMSMAFGEKAPMVDIALSGSGMKVEELKKISPALGDLSGEVQSFSVKASGPADALKGTIEFNAPKIGARGYTLSSTVAQVKVAPGTATVSGKSLFEGAPVTMQGSVADYMTLPKLNLTANIRAFDLAKAALLAPEAKNLALTGSLNGDVAVKGTATAPAITGKVWSDRVSAMKELFESPSVEFSLKGDQVSVTKSAAKWRGANLSASGTANRKGALNITALLENIQPSGIASFYPDIAQYKIKGAVTAKAVVTGTTLSPKIDLIVSSASLGLMDGVAIKNLKAETSLAGDPGKLAASDIALTVGASSVSAAGMGVNDLGATVKKRGQMVTIESLSARMGKGSLAGKGTAKLASKAGEEGTLDLAFDIANADLAALASAGGLGVPLAGTANVTASVKGTFSTPSIAVKGTSPRVSVAGMTGTDVALDLSGTPKELTIQKFGAKFGGGALSATGKIRTGGATPDVTIDLSGNDLDLAALTSGMPDAAELGVSGKMNLTFAGRFAGSSGSGQGSLTSPALTLLGLKGANLKAAIGLDGNILSTNGASLSLYGGTGGGTGTIDLGTMKFQARGEVQGVDLNGLIQDFTGGLQGKVTGLVAGSANLSGTLSPLAYSGKGSATVGEGAMSGFKGLTVLTALYGSSSVRYTDVVVPFRLGTKQVVLEKGTQVNAHAGDKLYEYLTAEGPVGPNGALKLQCAGSINLQVLNVIAGGALGALGGGLSAKSLEGILKGALGGAQESGGEADYRKVSFTVGGTTAKPSLANLKVAPGAQQDKAPAAVVAPADPAAPVLKPTVQNKITDAIGDALGLPKEQPVPAPKRPAPVPEEPAPIPEEPIQDEEGTVRPTQVEPEPQPLPEPPAPKKTEDVIKDTLLESIFKR